MTKSATVAEVQLAGVTIEAEEAVAIAQQLIDGMRSGDVPAEPPYGPPTTATVVLGDDGSVVCRTCETTPAVSEIAILLQSMLPGTRVPGGLHYAIARALLDVDVPPFDSLADFAETLARYERGPRQQIIQRVLERLDNRRALVPWAAADRRRHPRATELRRALREADARLYLQKVASESLALTVAARSSRPRHLPAAAACIAAGLLLIAAGEFIDGPRPSERDASNVKAPVVAEPYQVRDVATTEKPELLGPTTEPRAEKPAPRAAVPRTPNAERRVPTSEPHKSTTDRTPRASRRPAPVSPAQGSRGSVRKPPASSRSVLQRLRLNWLRNALTSL